MTQLRPPPPRNGRFRFAAALLAVVAAALLAACCPVPATSPGTASGAPDRGDAAWLVRVVEHRGDATRVESIGREGFAGDRRAWVRPTLELAPGREVYLRGSVADDGTFRWVAASPLTASDAP